MSDYTMSITHLLYVAFGVGLTIWVARTLRIHGQVFLAKGCKGDDALAEALSRLLSVGFYLLHVGMVLLLLKVGGRVNETVDAIELLSTKTGFVLIVLAFSHFVYLALYTRIHGKPKGPNGDHSASEVRQAMDF